MRLYDEQVLPRMINVLLGTKTLTQIRAETCAGLHGDVVEIGFGSGRNVPHLPRSVTGLWPVEPSNVGRKLAARRVAASWVPIHEAGFDGQHLEHPDDCFDCALSTATLCTIPDVKHALAELRRVVKPGGAFHFAEHGLSPDRRVARTQARVDGFQHRVAGGCHLTREIEDLIEGAGFEILTLHHTYLPGPKAWGYMSVGKARNP